METVSSQSVDQVVTSLSVPHFLLCYVAKSIYVISFSTYISHGSFFLLSKFVSGACFMFLYVNYSFVLNQLECCLVSNLLLNNTKGNGPENIWLIVLVHTDRC